MINIEPNLEYVVLVNNQDEVIGIEEKIKAHELGLLHRAFSIFVYRKTHRGWEFLLQQRHPQKYHCGGLWTNTCCSHPRLHEAVIVAAHRRLKEEMSLDISLRALGSFIYCASLDNGLIEHELDHVLVGEYTALGEIAYDPEEVVDFCWMSSDRLQEALSHEPHLYTPWLAPAFALVRGALWGQA